MVATKNDIAAKGNEQLATRAGEEIAVRGTIRGKTHLSLADLEAKVGHYPEALREKTRAVQAFFVQHCDSDVEQLRGLAVETLKIERSPEYFSNWIKGYMFRGGTSNVREQGRADWLDFCERVLEHDRLTAASGKLGTIMTGTVRAIVSQATSIMDAANPCRIAGIVGPTGSQKSASLKHLTVKLGGFPHAAVLECTEGMGLTGFKRALADVYNCKVGNRAGIIDAEIAKQMNARRFLAVENIQRACSEAKEQQAVIEFLVRLQETRGFPLALTFTRFFLQSITTGKNAGYYEQLVGRMGGLGNILMLPDYTPKGDLRAIAHAYNLHDGDEAMKYLTAWSRLPGRIRVVFARLYRARLFAKADGRDPITIELLKEVDGYTPPQTIGGEEEAS